MKLTYNVAIAPLVKSTPPHSPRTLSIDGNENTKKGRAGNSSSSADGPHDDNEAVTSANLSNLPNTSAPVKPPRGKLKVKIPEARGIRPSYYPYAVCVFEWNESIARGITVESDDTENIGTGVKDHMLSGISTKPTPSDMGRSMAIPMKSRQGSTTSLSDHKNFKTGRQLTEPKWDHEAELCAQTVNQIYLRN